MNGLRLSRYVVAVRSLEAARQGFERRLGMRALGEGRDDDDGARWLSLGGSTEAVRLMEPTLAGGALDAAMRARSTERNPGGEGFYRGVWETGDLSRAKERLRAHATDWRVAADGSVRVDPRRTHGVRMELRPAPPRSAPLERDDGALLRLSHIGVAVRSHERAIATFAALFGMATIGPRQEIPAAALATQWVGFGTRRIFTLLQPLSEESPVATRMSTLALDGHPEGEGVYIVAWATAETESLGGALEAAGVSVVRTPGPAGTILRPHPRLTAGAYIEVLPLAMNTDQWT